MNVDRLAWPAGWPRTPPAHRKDGHFGTMRTVSPPGFNTAYKTRSPLSIAEAVRRVIRELDRIDATDFILSTNLRVRNDGMPLSSQAAPADPGVAVYWTVKRRRLVMAIDAYNYVEDNIAAIAATLEAMRAIDRHGGAQILERAFTGFESLPPPKSCWDILGLAPGASRDQINTAYRDLALRHHPDRPGGSRDRMSEINQARDEALRQVQA